MYFEGGVEHNGKQYYSISLPYHEAVYEVTADSVTEVVSDEVGLSLALDRMTDKELALKLEIRSFEVLIARDGQTSVEERFSGANSRLTSLQRAALKKLGLRIR
jgi:hypothetical protein